MNRRNFFKALTAVPIVAIGGAVATKDMFGQDDTEVRRVMFNPPSELPAIYWMEGHMPAERFVRLYELGDIAIPLEQVKHGWASRKLSWVSMFLSDKQLPNFEPITYWLRTEKNPVPVYRWELDGDVFAPLEPQYFSAVVFVPDPFKEQNLDYRRGCIPRHLWEEYGLI